MTTKGKMKMSKEFVTISEEDYRAFEFYKKIVTEALVSYFIDHEIAEKAKKKIESQKYTKPPGETCSENDL